VGRDLPLGNDAGRRPPAGRGVDESRPEADPEGLRAADRAGDDGPDFGRPHERLAEEGDESPGVEGIEARPGKSRLGLGFGRALDPPFKISRLRSGNDEKRGVEPNPFLERLGDEGLRRDPSLRCLQPFPFSPDERQRWLTFSPPCA